MDTTGVQIISDGTSDGTHVLLDGRPVRGVIGAKWEISPRGRKATLTLELKDVRIDAKAVVDQATLAAIGEITDRLP